MDDSENVDPWALWFSSMLRYITSGPSPRSSKCPAKAVAMAMGSGLGDAAEIAPWNKHMATGSPVSQLRSAKPQQPGYLGGSDAGGFVILTAVMLLEGMRGCWYQLSLRPRWEVKMGVATHGSSSWGLAQAHRRWRFPSNAVALQSNAVGGL